MYNSPNLDSGQGIQWTESSINKMYAPNMCSSSFNAQIDLYSSYAGGAHALQPDRFERNVNKHSEQKQQRQLQNYGYKRVNCSIQFRSATE